MTQTADGTGHPAARRLSPDRAWHACASYFVAAIAATWPLALGLGRDVPWDLGDSLLVMWILSWDCERLLRILTGDVSSILTFFDANIFHPAPLTLAYSEHLVPQALQILPVYLISRNPILCYNLLFLSTIVLSGLGMYLLVRESTGNGLAAFVAGLLFAFAPYRLPQSGHLQVLSAQWMPFVLYGLLRFFHTGRVRPLAGSAAALILQNLSSAYYVLFFTPLAVAFALWQVARLGLWRSRRTWMALSGAGLAVAAVTAPFLLPYAAIRAQGIAVRSLTEAFRFSADVYSYATASGEQLLWGTIMRTFPKPEGELFPGAVAVLLALVGVVFGGRAGAGAPARHANATVSATGRAARWLVVLLAATVVGYGGAAVATLLVRRIELDMGLFVLQMSNVNQLFLRAGAAFVLLLLVSPPVRARTRELMRDRGFFMLGLVAAWWLSLGPVPQSLGRPVEIAAPYRLLLENVPGFDGVRVPARFAMIVAFAMAVLAGYGAAALSRARVGRGVLVAAAAIGFLEGVHIPFILNRATPPRDFNQPEARVHRPERAPAVYRELVGQPSDAVVAELPLGSPDYDLRAMYYSTVHWRPVVNGYSGYFPPHWGPLVTALSEIPRHVDFSLQALREIGATHLILHEAAYRDDEGTATAQVLRDAGAVELFRDGSDVLFRLPR